MCLAGSRGVQVRRCVVYLANAVLQGDRGITIIVVACWNCRTAVPAEAEAYERYLVDLAHDLTSLRQWSSHCSGNVRLLPLPPTPAGVDVRNV